jgi:hypothetical protein
MICELCCRKIRGGNQFYKTASRAETLMNKGFGRVRIVTWRAVYAWL